MATRQNYWSATEGSTSTSSSTYSDAVALTFTPDASSNYLVIGSWEADPDTGSHMNVRLRHDTASTTAIEFVHRSVTTSDKRQDCAFLVYEAPGSPSSQTFSVEFNDRFNFISHSIARRRLMAIKLADTDEYSTLGSAYTTTSDSYGDAHSLTFTPATSGDYLILACAQVGYSGSGNPLVQLVTDGTTTHADTQATDRGDAGSAPTRRACFFAANVATLAASSKTVKIQLKSDLATHTVSVDKACIVAIRLDELSESFYAESHSGQDNTTTSFADAVTTTETLSSGENYFIVAGGVGKQVSGDSAENQVNFGGTTIAQPYYDPNVSGSEAGVVGMIYRTTASGSTTFDLKFRKAGTQTATITGSVLAILRLEEASGSTAYEDSITEGVDLGATLGAAMAAAQSISEGLTGSDAPANASAIAATITQGVTASTALTVISGIAASRTEAITISDVESIVSGVNASLSEAVGIAAAEVASLAMALSISQGIAADVSQAGGFAFTDSISEDTSAGASQAGALAGVGSISEAIAAAASQAVIAAIAAAISEGAGLGHTQTLPVNAYTDSVTEAIGLSAAQVGAFALNAALTQGASVQDAVAAAAAYYAAVAEALSIAENIVGAIGGEQDVLELASVIARAIESSSAITRADDLTATVLRILETTSTR